MKNFRQYLAESARTYSYRIKVAGSPEKNWIDLFCINLQKFDPVKIGEPKTTPIQKEPYGFPGVTNQPVTIIDVDFKYPAVEPMIKQLAKLLNYDENMVLMVQRGYDDSMAKEAEQFENQVKDSPVLDKEELADAGKDANKEYGEQYLPRIMKDFEKEGMDIKYAAPKTKPAEDIRKIPGNNQSPMSKINRPPRPATGAVGKTK